MTADRTTWWDLVGPRAHSDAPAVITPEQSWSGRQLFARAAGGADFLDEAGAPRGRPVVTLLASTADAFALTLGAAATDRALAPLGPRLTASELVPCVEPLESELIVHDPAFEAIALEVARATGRRAVPLPALPESGSKLPARVDPERPAVILHTSGTTGRPKAVPYRQDRLAVRSEVNAALVALGPGSVYASASPFHHIAGLGMLLVAMASGAALLSLPAFDLAAWRELADRGVTHALLVPSMIEMLLDAGALALPSLRALQYGASPIRPETLARAIAVLPGVGFVNLFGQTEGSPIAALTIADHERAARDRPDLLASVGRAAPGVELFIDRPDDHGVGEVVARGPHLFAVDEQGWLYTGDLGHLDAEGYLFLSGRKGDKIIRGGENVYPVEVEHVLATHPAIHDVCVYALPDPRLGEIVAATVVVAPGETLPPWDELRQFARTKLAGFKVPTRWETAGALPRNAAGKVLRRELQRRSP